MGYWQIKVHPDSQEKTAFITHSGLYKSSAFQERVLAGLNPEDGPSFVAVYLDDALIFSRTLDEHLTHLQLVLDTIIEAGLKLKSSKCKFVQQEVKYLGHVITPAGLKPNADRVAAVKNTTEH